MVYNVFHRAYFHREVLTDENLGDYGDSMSDKYLRTGGLSGDFGGLRGLGGFT